MPPVNLTEIVYNGSQGGVQVRELGRIWTFVHGKPIKVPDAFAKRLLRKSDFIRPADLLKTVSETYPTAATVVLRRWGALGDLLMFRVACAAFRRARPDLRLVLKCNHDFAHIFAGDPTFHAVWSIGKEPPAFPPLTVETVLGHEFNMDRTAEVDHKGRGDVDRITLFLEKLMDPKLEVRPEDWDIPLTREAMDNVDRWMAGVGLKGVDRPLIAVQVRGSGPQKTIKPDQLKRIVAEISKLGNVVLIEHDEAHVWKAPGVFAMTGRDAMHAIALLRRCTLAVTADSGALWLAHAARCPVVIFMGPRPTETRTNRHPLGPKGASGVALNRLVVLSPGGKPGCEPCFERAEACKSSFACIREQPDSIIIPAIIKDVEAMLKAQAGGRKASRKK